MRAFATWLAGTLLAFAALGGGYHYSLSTDPYKLAVIVDSSYPMTDAWQRVPGILRGLGERRYSVFSLSTEKTRVHGWQARIEASQLTPYGPRSFERLASGQAGALAAEADRVVFVTNAPEAELPGFAGWEILRP